MKETTSRSIRLNATLVRYKQSKTMYGQNILSVINGSSLPFDISLESLKPYEHFQAGFNYSNTGMRIHLSRKNFDQLQGSYYGPTFLFSLLSLVSYTISTDVVSCSFLIKMKH